MIKRCGVAVALILVTAVLAIGADAMQAFPFAEKGMVRYVLHLPQQEDESGYKVELIVGQTVRTDKDNRYFLSGKIEVQTITGWGFPRYKVNSLGQLAGTRMAVDPNSPKVDRFVMLGGEPYLIRYNSRLPVVIYVPEGAEVRYRIWSARDEMRPMQQG